MLIHSSTRYNDKEHFHLAVREMLAALDVAFRGELPDPDTEAGHYEIVALRQAVDKLDWALIRGLSKTLSSIPKPQSARLELSLEDLGL